MVALRAWLPLSPKMAGERDDTRDFNLSNGGQIGRLQRMRPLTSQFAPEHAHISCPPPRSLLDSCPVDSPIHHRCNHYSLSHKPTVNPAGVFIAHTGCQSCFSETELINFMLT